MKEIFTHLTESETRIVSENLEEFICDRITKMLEAGMMDQLVSFPYARRLTATAKATGQADVLQGPFYFVYTKDAAGRARFSAALGATLPSTASNYIRARQQRLFADTTESLKSEVFIPTALPAGVWESIVYPSGPSYGVALSTLVKKAIFPLVCSNTEFILHIINSVDWETEYAGREILHSAAYCDLWRVTKYFDADNILRLREMKESDARNHAAYKGWDATKPIDRACWCAAGRKWKEGTPLIDCLREALLADATDEDDDAEDVQLGYSGVSELERLCTSVQKPVFICREEYKGRNVFDHIHITVGLNSILFRTTRELFDCVCKHKREIDKLVVEKLRSSKQFQRFGVPVNALRLAEAQFSPRDYTIEYIFELKNAGREGTDG